MTDLRIIDLLKSNKTDKAFYRLYKSYPQVEKIVLSKGGTKFDAQDVFQEALIVLYKKVMNTDFKLSSKISTYLYSVCRFIWKDELIKSKRNKSIDFNIDLIPDDLNELEGILESEIQFRKVEEIIHFIGVKCQVILQLFYFKNLRMKEIAIKMGYSSENVAKTQKYKCIEKAKSKLSLNHIGS